MKVELIDLLIKGDERGSLIALEGNKNIPFEIKRVYYIFDTKNGVRRGFHAHKNLKQVLVATSGSCKILLNDGKDEVVVELNSRNKALQIDKMIWHEMYDFSADCVLMVLADNYYGEDDYIRNYDDFLKLTK